MSMKPRTVFYLILVVKLTKQDSSEYIPVLVSHMLAIQILLQSMLIYKSDPAFISTTIAHVPSPPTKEIIAGRNRFAAI